VTVRIQYFMRSGLLPKFGMTTKSDFTQSLDGWNPFVLEYFIKPINQHMLKININFEANSYDDLPPEHKSGDELALWILENAAGR